MERNFPKELNVVCGRESKETSMKTRPRTLANDCNEIKADCINDAPNLLEFNSKKLNQEAIGNILGESCLGVPPSNVVESRGRASAMNNIQSTANAESPNEIEEHPATSVANGSPNLIPGKELPPNFEAAVQIAMVDNPFLPTFSRKAEATQEFWPSNLIQLVRETVKHPSSQPSDPEFKFTLDREAAVINFEVLKKYELNLEAALDAQKNSPLGYGSEFRPTRCLKSIFKCHPNWKRMKSILENGSAWPLEDLPDANKKRDLAEALAFGNHKGAKANPKLLRKLVEKDVLFGYGLVLPLESLRAIPGALLAPMNIMKQNTINKHGRIMEKDRLTHDQSYTWGSGTSVNSRVVKDSLLPCRFGACLKRLMNWTVAARKKVSKQKNPGLQD